MFTNQPPPIQPVGLSPGGQFQHPHESSLLRAVGYSPGAQYQQSPTNHGYSPGAPGAQASTGHPLGNLANPIQWDDASDARDDRPTMGSPGGVMPINAGISAPSPDPPAPGRQKARPAREMSKKKSNKLGKSKSKVNQSGNKATGAEMNVAPTTKQAGTPTIHLATLVKHDQVLLPSDSQAYITSPKITIHKTNAILTSDKFVHIYSFTQNQWVQTTTVSLQNTHGLSLALSDNTAVIGVPYDHNSKGLLTGSAYIFERDEKSNTWYQVKKM